MKTSITPQYITTLLTALTNLPQAPDWQPDTRYLEGAKVKSGARIYVAFTGGTTSKIAPSHSSGKVTDGTVTWLHVFDTTGRQTLGDNLYLALGNPGEWKNEPTPDDIADEPIATGQALESAMTLVRLATGDISLGAVRREWTSGVVIPEWPAVNSYVLVGTAIYRCLSNNNDTLSTSSPTGGNSITPFEVADGYVWKYLGDISISQDQRFGQTTVFPIAPLNVDDGSDRWIVQSLARNGGISGFVVLEQTGSFTTPVADIIGSGTGAVARADLNGNGTLRRVVATQPGLNYSFSTPALAIIREQGVPGSGATATATITDGEVTGVTIGAQGTGYSAGAKAFVVGDGIGAELSVTVTGGYVTGVSVVSGGSGYTSARIVVVPGLDAAVARSVMAPVGGHGRDITKEIPVEYLLVNRRLNALEAQYIPDGDIRQFSILTAVRVGSGQGELMVGPKHPSPAGKDAAVLTTARALLIMNVETIEHTPEQYEEVNVAMRLA